MGTNFQAILWYWEKEALNSPGLALTVSGNRDCDWIVVGKMGCVCVCELLGRLDRAMTFDLGTKYSHHHGSMGVSLRQGWPENISESLKSESCFNLTQALCIYINMSLYIDSQPQLDGTVYCAPLQINKQLLLFKQIQRTEDCCCLVT